MAGVQLPFEDGWGDLITWATAYGTLSNLHTEPMPESMEVKSLIPNAPHTVLVNGNGGGV